MFWTADDVQPAVNEAVRLFGVQGRIGNGKVSERNISIATREYGKLWYGDISEDHLTFKNKLNELANSIKQTVYVLSSDSYDFNDPLYRT